MSSFSSYRITIAGKRHVCLHCEGVIEKGRRHIASTWFQDDHFDHGHMHFECKDAWQSLNWGKNSPRGLSYWEEARALCDDDIEAGEQSWLEKHHPLVTAHFGWLSLTLISCGVEMATPVRLQLSRRAGFNLQALSQAMNGLPAVKVTRPGPWGNPFNFRDSAWCWLAVSFGCKGNPEGRQEASVKAFREWVDAPADQRTQSMERQVMLGDMPLGPKLEVGPAPAMADIRRALSAKNLACWCKLGAPCHADVLLEIANRPVCEAVD